jgi:hypothetical protein
MMVCSLMLFVGIFQTAEEAISEFDKIAENSRKDVKQSTSSHLELCQFQQSQRRYVKFFEGFLTYELVVRNEKREEDASFYQKYLL